MEAVRTIRAGLARPLTYWLIDPQARLGEDQRALDLKAPKLAPEASPSALRQAIKARDTALYIYTSGTTGMPKAAKIAHTRAQLYMRAFAGAAGAKADDKIYCALPLYHSTGGLCGVGAALLNGATLVLRKRFSASHFWDDIVGHDCTMFVYIGELCRYLVNQPHIVCAWPSATGCVRKCGASWRRASASTGCSNSTARPKATSRCSTLTANKARLDVCRLTCAFASM
jgi:fatty-acyl-CoA synthase